MLRWPRHQWRLLNGSHVDAVPAASVRARANAHARRLARAVWLLRRKRDGRYLATLDGDGRLDPLHPQARGHDAGLAEWLDCLERGTFPAALDPAPTWQHLLALGVPSDYGQAHALDLVPEPGELAFAGFDRYARPLWLTREAAGAWQRMRRAALADGVRLDAISGFRSHDYQMGIFERKQARGQQVGEILAVNAAPGFSEHHSGRALDISTPGEPAAEESFEHTPAFDWLQRHAGRFGFAMSYPRDNPHGIIYEPWHWCWHAGQG